MDAKGVLRALKRLAKSGNVEGMKRFGIVSEETLGVPTPELRSLANRIGKSHKLALELWKTGIYEARQIAGMIDEPEKVTQAQMERWVKRFDSWAICDGICMNLFVFTPFAWKKAVEWSKRDEEYVKRAGFSLMATLAVNDKESSDERFAELFEQIKKGSADDRLYVRKAVNWALRQIGKRNSDLNKLAIVCAKELSKYHPKSARWIARDALKELRGEKIQERLKAKNKKDERKTRRKKMAS